jgi:hypothetical protein
MHRKIKALGLALVAAFALTAVMASAASAAPGFTSSSSGTTTIHGVQNGNHEFAADEGFGGIKCKTATFAGTSSGTYQATQTVKPTYSNCEDSFGRPVHIKTNTLTYVFKVTGTDSKKTPIGEVHVSGDIELEITTGGTPCIVVINETQNNNGITYHNNANGTVTTTTESTNVRSTTSGGFFSCGTSNGLHTEGTYTGETVLTGTSGGAGATISVDAH